MPKQVTLLFQKEKDTKNTVKFQEVPQEGEAPRIGTLYVQKFHVGNADQLTVTLHGD